MKNFNFFERLWEHGRTLRRVGLVLVMCLMAISQMWGYNTIHLRSDPWTGGWSYVSDGWTYGGDGQKYWDVYHSGGDAYWRIKIDYYNQDYGPSTNNYVLNVGTSGYKVNEKNTSKCFKTTANAGIIRVCSNQTTGTDEYPYVWVERPGVIFKYPWSDGSTWTETSEGDVTDNNDGTYTYKSTYRGIDYFNAKSVNGLFKVAKTTTTVIGSPATGDRCEFKWTPSGYKLTGDEETNRGVFVITKLCKIQYDGNGKTGGSVPSDQEDILYNTATTVRGNDGTLVKTNYIFTGWNANNTGTGAHYAAGSGNISPTATTTTLYAEWEDVWNLKGSWDSWANYKGMSNVSSNTFQVTLSLAASTTYDFKVVKRVDTNSGNDTYYGKASTTFTRSSLTSAKNLVTTAGDTYNMHITTDVAGDYVFTFVNDASASNMKVLVKYPCATAGQTLYKFEVSSSRTSGNVCAAASTLTELTTDYALSSLAGGTLKAYETTSGKVKYVSGGAIQLSENSSNHYLRIDLDCPLQANDIIRFTNTAKASASVYLRHTSNTTTSNQVTLAGASTDAIVELPDAFAGKSSLWIVRGGDNANAIKSVEILRPYVVTLNAHDGTCSASKIKTMAGNVVLPHAFKDGYRFNGWYTDASGGTKKDDYYTVNSTITLHAQYTSGCPTSGKVFSLTMESSKKPGSTVNPPKAGTMDLIPYATMTYGAAFAGNTHSSSDYGGVTSAGVVQLNNANAYIKIDLDCALDEGDTIYVVSNTSSSNQYYLTAGSTRATTYTTSGTSTKTHSYIVTGSEGFSKTLYIWEGSSSVVVSDVSIKRPAKYTVTYNAGTGTNTITGSHADDTKIHGASLTLPDAVFEQDGYTQTGWATENGGDKVYDLEQSYTANANVDLYPVWEEEAASYTLTYDKNGGSGDAMSNTVGSGSITLSTNTYTYSGYNFAGWATSDERADAGTVDYTDGDTYTLSSDATLHAVWQVKTPSITFSNDITNTVTITCATASSSIYYTLDNSTPSGSSTSYSSAFTINANKTVKAIAKKSGFKDSEVASLSCTYVTAYTVTYNLNGGEYNGSSTAPTQAAVVSGTSISMPSLTPTKDGYVFLGWTSSANSTDYAPSASYTMTAANTTFTAHWIGYATSWEWWNSGASHGSTTFTYLTGKNYVLSFTTDGDNKATWDTGGGIYYRGVKLKTKDDNMSFWVQSGKEVSITFGTRPTKPTFTVGGVDKSSEVGASTNADSITVTYTTTADTKFYIENETSTGTAFTIKRVKIENAGVKHNVTFALTNVVYSSGDNEGTNAATEGSAFSVVFAPASRYTLPDDITVEIGGATATIDDDYTWDPSTGELVIDGASITGNIVVTIEGDEGPIPALISYYLQTPDDDTQPGTLVTDSIKTVPATLKGDTLKNFANVSLGSSLEITGKGKDDNKKWTAKIGKVPVDSTTTAVNEIKLSFDIHDDYELNITSIKLRVLTVGNSNVLTYRAKVTDGVNTVYGRCVPPGGKDSALVFSSFSGVKFSGTLTLSLWAWGVATDIRLKSPIQIDGSLTKKPEPEGFTISFAGNGNTGGSMTDVTEIEEGNNVTLAANGFVKNGYTFANWTADVAVTVNSATVAAGDPIADEATIQSVTSDITLTAQWTPNDYTITYHLNGASWASSAGVASYTVGTGATLPIESNMTNTGYTFGGWYDNSSLTGSAVTNISTSDYGNKEFWAKWTENEYDVTYNANGGSGDDMSATHGHYVTISDNSYTAPSGKTFVEWNTANNGSGASYNPGDEIELTADLPLYAIWSKAIGTINWSVTKVDDKLYRGGGGYSVTAEINDASWDASASDASKLELTATEGVVLKNVTTSINASGKAQITANFDITTDVNANATKITFTINVPENNGYAPIEDSHDESLTSCVGSSIIWDFTNQTGAKFTNNVTYSYLATDASTEMRYTAGSSCEMVAYDSKKSKNGYLKENGGTSSASATDLDGSTPISKNRLIRLFVSTGSGKLKITCNSDNKGIWKVLNGSASGTELIKALGADTTSKTITVTTSPLWIETTMKGYIEQIMWTPSGGGSTVTPTLTWSGSLADAATVNKYDTDVDFTYTASQDKNSLGALTYSSSDATVATVNASGKVHILKAGTTTITANLAESGCYEEAEITYRLNVISTCTDVAGTLTAVDNGCDGVNLTVSGHTGEGVNTTDVKWYKDGVYQNNVAYNNKESITVTAAGEWSAQTTAGGAGHCVRNSNSVTVTARSTASATRIVNQWYVKNGRRTPDIALVQTTNATDFTVAFKGSTAIWDPTNSVSTGFGGCPFRLGADGIIYLDGQSAAGEAPTGMTVGDTTITITAKGCGAGNELSVDIKLHVQAATDRPSVAFVVDGTKEGAFDAENEDHSVNTELYQYLDYGADVTGAFDLTGQNVYSTVDEQAIREHYSQFDAILITDDPSTDTKIGKKSCVDAFGTMIDVRPMLTMEAFVSKWGNWKAKGIDGNPESPNPRQYKMKLQCKDHAIFKDLSVGTNVETETIDGVEYWTVTMVDNTKSPYSGVADGTDTDTKPALQGFSADDVNSLLLLGEISGGSLYAGVERQEETAARLMLLGLNAKALPNALTPEGKKVIENALKYLIETDLEKVDDCSNYFTGKTSTDWNTDSNWSKGHVPHSPNVRVRILSECVINSGTYKVAEVDIATSGKSLNKAGEMTGKLTINAGAALIVGGKIRTAKAPYFNTGDLKPTTEEDLVINTSSTAQAALIFNNDAGDTKATVNLYSLGRKISSTYQFQYFAVPMTYIDVNPAFAGSGIYTYVWNEASGWERRGYYVGLEAFEGVGITTKFADATTYQMKGTLASTATKEITLTHEDEGHNLIGNSWTAPIQISQLEEDNSSLSNQTVYIYNTGNDDTAADGYGTGAGQWTAIPFNAAGFDAWDGLKVIPAMQAFEIVPDEEETLTLDYDKVVRGDNQTLTEPLRAPKASHEGIELMRIRVADSNAHADLYLFEGSTFSDEFDNGWEAAYMDGDDGTTKLYADVALGRMAVVATDELEGTLLGFAPGKETEYTFTFGGEGMGYYLNDLKLKTSTLINEEATYSFTFEEGDTNRFYISRTPIEAPQTPTGVDNTRSGEVKAQKFIYNDKMYIMINGRVYSAEGQIVK